MPLEIIIWNDVYTSPAKEDPRILGEYRIYMHYIMLGLTKRNITRAIVG